MDVDSILHYIGYGPLQIYAFILAALTALAFGADTAVLVLLDIPVQKEWNLTSVEYALMPSLTAVGNVIGSLFYGYLSDNYGRVWPYVMIMIHFGLTDLASAFSPNFATLTVLRVLVSIANTGTSVVLFPTILEFLPVKNRGKIIVVILLMQFLGTCLVFGLGWWIIPTYPIKYGWRYLIFAASILYFIVALYRTVFHIESPRFLIAKGRYREAKRVFVKMARLNGKILEIEQFSINTENRHQDRIAMRKSLVIDFLAIFKRPYLRTTVCLSVIFVSVMSSYYSLSVFLPLVLKEFGLDPYFTTFVGYLGQLPGIVLLSIIVEWPGVGRLNSLRFFTLISMGSFILFAFVENKAAISVSIIFAYFSMAPLTSLLFTYISEVYSTNIRSFSLAYYLTIAVTASFGTFFLAGYLAAVKPRWIYPMTWAVVFLVQFVVSLFLNIETLDRGLSDNNIRTHN